VGTQLPKDMVYTITSGFYPELFTKDAGWKRSTGSGRKGMQWSHVRGWGKGSIQKTKGGEAALEEPWVGRFFGKLGQGQPWDKAYQSLEGPQKEAIQTKGQKLGMSQEEMETRLTKAKFMGSGEHYKLWGSRVWYQHGERENKSIIEKDLTEWMKTKKNLPVYLQNLYSSKEGALVKMAKALAKDAFGEALDESNLRKDLESVGGEADVPEEEYKEFEGGKKVNAIPSSFEKITQARQADIKYRMKEGTSLYLDSTEMPIHQANQHGIVEENIGGMQKAIKAAKEGGEEEIEALREAVVKMFIANASLYNKEITKLVKTALPKKDQGKGLKSIEKILKNITKANKSKDVPPNDPRASVSQVGAILGIDTAEKTSRSTALKYIIHTVVNLAGDANQNFRQGHFVGVINNQNAYASVPMQLENTTKGIPQFMKSVISAEPPNGVAILQGGSHLLAIMEKDRNLSDGKARETKARQIQAFSNGKIMGITASGQQRTKTTAQTNLRTRVRQSTTVTFAPKSFEKLISKIPDVVASNTSADRVTKAGESFMSNKRKHKLASYGSTKFWAMPYVGLMEYPTKSE
tara:strand:+ start:637 stop:2370 length:1734 start_codon:yes stop_codon:yes gene_type:complete